MKLDIFFLLRKHINRRAVSDSIGRFFALLTLFGTVLTADAAGVPTPAGIIGWWQAESNALDSIGINHGTLVGGASYVNGEVGKGVTFDGTTGFVNIPDSPSLDVLTNQLTVELWLKMNDTNNNPDWKGIVTKGNSSWRLMATAGGKSVAIHLTGTSNVALNGLRSVKDGQWHHVAAVYDGTMMFLYVDGTLDVSQASTGLIAQTTDPLCFGKSVGSLTGYYLNGTVDEVSLYHRALSSNEIASIYNAGSAGKLTQPVPVPVPSGIIGWWKAETNALDSIGTNNGTLVGGVVYTNGEVSKAFSFDGTSGYVNIPDSPSIHALTNRLTVELWLKMNYTNNNPDWKGIVTKGNSSWHLQATGGAKSVTFVVDGTSNPYLFGNRVVNDGQWHHVAAVYDGTNILLFVDGTLDVSQPSTGLISQNNYPMAIGELLEAPGPYFLDGSVDEVSLYNRALTSNEIAGIYAAGSAGKYAPSTPSVPVPPGIIGWWQAETNALDNIGTNNGTLVGGVVYTNGEVGNAFSFDGTSGYVSVPDSASLDALTNQMTVELWLKMNDTNNNPDWIGIVTKGNTSWRLFGTGGAKTIYFGLTGTSGSDLFGARNVKDGQWHHVAGVYDGTNISLYVDGTLDVSKASTGLISQNNYPMAIGELLGGPNPNYYLNGMVDEVSLYHRALTSNEIAGIYSAGSAGKTVPLTPPLITSHPTNQTVTVGQNAAFSVQATGSPTLIYQWRFNTTNIVWATNASITLTNVQLSQAGNYSVVVSNLANSITSSNALLTVNPPVSVPPPSGLISWWRAESNALDSIGTNNGTLVGGAGYTNGTVGKAFSFDGSSGYVNVPDSASLGALTNQMTIELWLKMNDTNNNPDWIAIACKGSTSWRLFGTGSAKTIYFGLTGTSGLDLFGTRNVKDGQWHHVAGVYDGTNMFIYVDGTLDVSKANTGLISQNSTAMGIGRNLSAPAPYFLNGSVDEVSLYHRALTSNEIASIYAAGSAGKTVPLTPPLITSQPTNQTVTVGQNATFSVQATGSPTLVYQWRFSTTNIVWATNAYITLTNVQLSQAGNYSVVVSNLADLVTSSNALLTVNPPVSIPPPSGLTSWWRAESNTLDSIGSNHGTLIGGAGYVDGEVGKAFSFDGASGYVNVPDSVSLDSFTNRLTIELWLKMNDTNNNPDWRGIVTKGNSSWRLFGTGSAKTIWFGLDGTTNPYLYGNKNVKDGQWHHVAATYDGTNMSLYVDGTLDASQASTGLISQNNYAMAIGELLGASHPNYYMNGMVDEVSLYSRALTSNEIASIYNAGSSGKTVPVLTPPLITMQPTNQTVTVGQNATFSVQATGSPTLIYQWRFNTTNIVWATNASITLTNVQLSQAGNYSVVVSNLVDLVVSSNALLTVIAPPVITSFSPTVATNGASVSIFGSNFSPVIGQNTVYFGAVKAVVESASTTNLAMHLPVGATYAPITVTVNGLTAYANKSFMPTFTGGGGGLSAASFGSRQDLTSGNGPTRVVIADVDGDGKPDLIAANVYDHTISIYPNTNGVGTLTPASFGARVDFATTSGSLSPIWVAVADLDGDGKLDIIASDYSDNAVSVYRNTCTPGNITTNGFSTRVEFITGASPDGIEVRDIDGDGKPDLLVANSGSSTVSILRNTGSIGVLDTNSFAPKVDITTGSGSASVAAGDLDGDGKPDLVTANYGSGTITLLRNISSPGTITTNSFASKVDFTVLSEMAHVTIGDLDGDGKPDLSVMAYSPATLSVFRNISSVGTLSTNSFASRIDYALGGRGRATAIGDLDGDGKPDLAGTSELNSLIAVFRNMSTPGNFTNSSLATRLDLASGSDPWGVSIGDLNGDGRPEIVFPNQYSPSVSIYQNQVPFAQPPMITLQPTNQTVSLGQNTTFSVQATGSPTLVYQWRFNTTNIVWATNASITLTNVQFSQAGSYSVLVSNSIDYVVSSNAVLTVIDALHHFTWDAIPSPRFVDNLFTVTIKARNANDSIFTNFSGTVSLSSTNGVNVNPATSGNFVGGVWTGTLKIAQTITNLVLKASDGSGHVGLANSVSVVSTPVLGMNPSGGFLLFYWPVDPSSFVLETSGSLSPANWVPASQTPFQIGNNYQVLIPISPTNGFYRLRFTGP